MNSLALERQFRLSYIRFRHVPWSVTLLRKLCPDHLSPIDFNRRNLAMLRKSTVQQDWAFYIESYWL